jgi:DNA invertase Pin-like site-specific DNA recombinase
MTAAEAARLHGQRVGYVRVSSVDQNTDRQLEGINAELPDRVFTDKCSGKDTKRPELQAMLKHVRAGDTVLIHSLDRLGRNLGDLCKLVGDLNGKGIAVKFLNERLTFDGADSKTNTLLFHLLGAVAEFERAMIRERQREGIQIAMKDRKKYRGGKPKLTAEKAADLRKRVSAGEKKAGLAREFGISRETLYAYLQA